MSQKISVRLPPALNDALQQAARDRGVSPSGLIRAALHQFLSPSPLTDQPLTALSPDAWEAVLARCPSDVQAKIRQAIDRTDLALGDVLRALLISAASAADTAPATGLSPEGTDATMRRSMRLTRSCTVDATLGEYEGRCLQRTSMRVLMSRPVGAVG